MRLATLSCNVPRVGESEGVVIGWRIHPSLRRRIDMFEDGIL
jgi:hypothetical protein